MANYMVTDSQLSSIANAIRSKGGTSASLAFPTGFVSAIDAIQDANVYKGVFLEKNISQATFRGVSHLVSEAFYNLPNLTSVTFPDCVTAGEYISSTHSQYGGVSYWMGSIFYNCQNLNYVNFPELLTIPASFFCFTSYNYNSNINSSALIPLEISFPKAVKIESNAFGMYIYNTNSMYQYYYIIPHISRAIFPQVTTIGSFAFQYCIFLREISFPKLSSIGNDVFYSCSNIQTAYMPTVDFSSVNMEFAGMTNLQNLTLSSIISTIPSNAFYNCYNLSNLSINFSQLTSIGTFAFYDCKSLNFGNNFSNSFLTAIEPYTFYGCANIASINLPNVTAIGSYAFAGYGNYDYFGSSYTYLKSLNNFYLPKVTTIGNCAFQYCYFSELTDASFNSRLSSITFGIQVFANCYNLSKVAFSGLTVIPQGMFHNCSNLNFVSFPNVTDIGSNAFSQSAFTSVGIDFEKYFPQVVNIGGNAFAGTKISKIDDTDFPKMSNILANNVFASCFSLTQVSFSKVISIGSSCFLSCQNLSKISFPEVTTIGSYAFTSCFKLSQLTSNEFPKVTTINDFAFQYCSSLAEINLSTVTTLQTYAFIYCTNLTSVNLPNLTAIPSAAFRQCSLLQECHFDNVISVYSYAFSGCSSLKNLTLPKAQYIYSYAFGYCKLSELSLPKVISIYMYAFSNCTTLKSLYLYGSSVPSLYSNFNVIFNSVYSTISIFVKASMYNSFRTAYRWSNYSSRIFSVPD